MCKNCYHAKGRTKLATKCEHKDRALYAKGVCKNCYLSIYHKKKRKNKKISNEEEQHASEAIASQATYWIVKDTLTPGHLDSKY